MNLVLSRFLRSPLGIGLSLACVLSAAALSLSGALPAYIAVPAAAAAGALLTVALLLSPLGARSVVAEADRDRAERDARVLGGVAAARKRLSLLRVENERIKAELDRLVLVAGKYLEKAVRTDGRDPEIEDAVLGAVEVVNDFLLLADELSAARRHGAERSDAAEMIDRTVRALAASSDEIEKRLAIETEVSDRADAWEELR